MRSINDVYIRAMGLLPLPAHLQATLADLPEDAMGSQYVDATLMDGTVVRSLHVVGGQAISAKLGIDPEFIAAVCEPQPPTLPRSHSSR